ncbi:HAMP domain-containing histidine kinase [Hydrogenophaga flava]|uniref:HAMP domain-containing histidine kinase n=1 Tax=Hydrogenophaga flava TaxID=65657 RepID=UPI000825579A|nr:HAMP domain-containing histidine kinase [Hydrogenophaga flava]
MNTPASAANNPLLVLLDFVASPLLLFGADGHVVFTNQAAKAMRCRPHLLLGSDPQVKALVRDVAAGRTPPSLELRVEALSDDGIARLVCRSAPRPVAGLVPVSVAVAEVDALDASPVAAAEVDQRLSLQQIMELLKAELLPPIQKVTGLLEPSSNPVLAQSVRDLQERLERMADLVNVFGEDVLIGEDRMLLPELVRSTAQELAPLTDPQGVSFVIEGDRNDLPPVYGSRRLMRRALYECLHNAVTQARQGVQSRESVAICIGFRPSGNHLLMNIHHLGVLSAAALSRHAAAIFRPVVDPKGTGGGDTDALLIGLPLTQRILQLHGGRLRIEQDSADGLQVMLELPTGAPMRNTHHLDMLQAQIYAEDLSKLMARTRRRSPA